MILLSFYIAGIPPTDNETRRLHWAAKGREVEAWRTAAKYSALNAIRDGAGAALPLRDVEVTYTFIIDRMRRQGIDALIGATKPILDGVVDAGVLADDGFLIVRRVIGETTPGPQAGVVVTLRPYVENPE